MNDVDNVTIKTLRDSYVIESLMRTVLQQGTLLGKFYLLWHCSDPGLTSKSACM